MSSLRIAGLSLGLCWALLPATAPAQFEIEPGQPQQRIYRVTVINQTGIPIHVKIAGNRGTYANDFRDGASDTHDLYSGWRVLCVWDRQGNLLAFGSLHVNRSGVVRLRGMGVAPAGAADGGAAGPARASAPKAAEIEIEPK